MVLPGAIVRDQFEGDGMARVFSLISAVFITVPVIAPTLGQAVLEVRRLARGSSCVWGCLAW